MALIAEAAELIKHFQWLTQEESAWLPEDKLNEVEQKLADILIYLFRISDTLGIALIYATNQKIEMNKEKYRQN